MTRKILFASAASISLILGSVSASAQSSRTAEAGSAVGTEICKTDSRQGQRGANTSRSNARTNCVAPASLEIARAPIEGEQLRGTGSGVIVALFGAAAVIGGIILLADEDEDGDDLPDDTPVSP